MGSVDRDDPGGLLWRIDRARWPPLEAEAEALGRHVDVDHDPAEESYWEDMWDSDAQALDNAQRRRSAQYLRRLHRLRSQRRHESDRRR
jgi:hypothetical protein